MSEPMIRGLALASMLGMPAVQAQHAALIEEIVVTAKKRGAEDVHGVAMSVSVIGRDQIDKGGLAEMDDYLRALPSANYLERGAGRNNVVLRGVTSDPQNDTTVGIYIGETPVTGLGSFGVGNPDVKLLDVERIEVLRGPQGTLYGDGSMGGTVRVIPARSGLEEVDLELSFDVGRTADGGGSNTVASAVLDLPVVETSLGLKLIGYRFDTSGYFRNIAQTDARKSSWGDAFGAVTVNETEVSAIEHEGGRILLDWLPDERFRVSIMSLFQETDQNGLPERNLEMGELEQARFRRPAGEGEALGIDFDLQNLVVEYLGDSVSIISSTSYAETDAVQDRDVGIFFASVLDVGDIPLFLNDVTRHESLVQEVRLSSMLPGRWQYLAGIFYHRIESQTTQDFTFEGAPSADPFAGALLFDSLDDRKLEQKALFGELSYDFNDRWSGAIGARLYDYSQDASIVNDGLFNGGLTTESQRNEDDGTTISAELDFLANDLTTTYLRYAQGFRLGATHPLVPSAVCDVDGDALIDGVGVAAPERVLPDELDTYEMGVKVRTRNRRLAVNSSLFLSDWTGIPVTQLAPCGFPVTLNAGGAESRGLEVEGSWAVNDLLTFSFGASYVDAELTQDAPALGSAGDRLPGTPRYQIAMALQADFSLRARPAFVRVDVLTFDEFFNNLQETGIPAGGYTTLALQAGVTAGPVRLDAYITNALDEAGLTWVDTEVGDGRAYALRPRTYGLRLTYRLGDDD